MSEMKKKDWTSGGSFNLGHCKKPPPAGGIIFPFEKLEISCIVHQGKENDETKNEGKAKDSG